MKPDEFLEFVKKRRSIRSFKPDPIPDGSIQEMLEAARWAPSPINAQPWEFIVVKSEDTRNRIAEIIEENWQRSFDIEKTRVMEVRHPKLEREEQRPIESWGNAPAIVVVCGDPRAGQAFMLIDSFFPLEGGQKALFYKSIANATLLLTLSATAHGLGSVWVSVPGTSEPALKELLGIPVEISVQSLVPVGYPSYEPAPSWRRELNKMVHYEKYDLTKFRSGDDVFNFLIDHRKRQRRIYPKRKDS
jgi:nitroreductase